MTQIDSRAVTEFPTAGHFGTYLARSDGNQIFGLRPNPIDGDPSSIGLGVPSTLDAPSRLTRPLVRRSYLRHGPGDTRRGFAARGDDPYVPVSWDTATGLVANEIARVRTEHGNAAIFGGSYGWGSAGRFHHPQSQIHRFLNLAGGYTASVESYSSAAMQVILRRVAGGYAGVLASNPTWEEVAQHRSLVVAFGGMAAHNSSVNGGGIGVHRNLGDQLTARRAGAEFVLISPASGDAHPGLEADWLPVIPGSDVAVMMALAYELVVSGHHDREFLDAHTVGWPQFEAYLLGHSDGIPKTPKWAGRISGIAPTTIAELGRKIVGRRTVFTTSYSLQRADHGEQAPWMALTLAALTGNLGLPGGGFGCALGALHQVGVPQNGFKPASFDQGVRPIDSFIPVARITDMLENPGGTFDYDGGRYTFPDTRLIYWAGGNPFHHHQDLNRLVRAWQTPETIVVHEHFANSLARHADIVLPAATWLERNDFAAGADDHISAIVKAAEPPPDVRTDFEIFSAIASRLGFGGEFTENRTADEWVQELYRRTRERAAESGFPIPDWDELRRRGVIPAPSIPTPPGPLRLLRENPEANPLATPTGMVEIFSETIDSFGYDDCLGHPAWFEPREWLRSTAQRNYPFHLLSGQPERRLHSQFDNGSHSRAGKIREREPIQINTTDALERGIADGDIVRVYNERGQVLAGAQLTESLRRSVVRLSTGAWYDPIAPGGLDVHGNPNVLTADRGTSRLAQGPSAHSALVQIEKYNEPLPPIRAFESMWEIEDGSEITDGHH